MASFNYYLLDNDKESKTLTPIYLNVFWRLNGKRIRFKYFHLLNKVTASKWDSDKQEVKNGFPNRVEINERLSDHKTTANRIIQNFESANKRLPTLKEFRDNFLKEIDKDKTAVEVLDFFNFFKKFIEESKIKTNNQTGRIISKNTIKLYNNALTHIKSFGKEKRKRIDFDTIDLDFYADFMKYLTKEKTFSTNTIGRIIKILKTVLNDATDRGINSNLAFRNRRFKVISEKTDSIYLTKEELNDLFHYDLSDRPRLEKVRDLFLIGCYTGLRYSDFSNLTEKNIENKYFEMPETQKTGQGVVIPLHPVVSEILKKYNNQLPECPSNQKMNLYLKEMANDEKNLKKLQSKISIKITRGGVTVHETYKKYELVCTHTARRSFATNAYLDNIPPFVIMGITGQKTEKAFFRYIKLTNKDKAKILEMYMNQQSQLKVV